MSASRNILLLKNFCRFCEFRLQLRHQLLSYRCKSTVSHHSTVVGDQQSFDDMKAEGRSHKKHLGIVRLKTVNIPESLEKSIDVVLEKYPVDNLVEYSQSMVKYLHARQVPVEKDVFIDKLLEIEEEMKKKANVDEESLSEEEKTKYENDMRRKVRQRIKRVIYHWQPMIYNAQKSLQYLVARTTANYSSILNCLNEIKIRDPDFNPKTIFDFGSGVGSTIWAANALWDNSVFEYYCVDQSSDMNTVARLLLQDGQEQKTMRIPGVYFRNFSPSSNQNKFNMVVCTYTLLELSSLVERQELVKELWNMTENYLVLIEKGGKCGFKLINEARQLLLHLTDVDDSSNQGHVFSPCAHDKPCPKLAERNSPCFFEAKHKPLKIMDRSGTVHKEWFSYIIFKTGPRPQVETMPRIIQEVKKPSRHTHCHLCCHDGKLRHVVISPGKHGKDLYKCSSYSQWGDQLPAKFGSQADERPQTVDNISSDKKYHSTSAQQDTEQSTNQNQGTNQDTILSSVSNQNEDNKGASSSCNVSTNQSEVRETHEQNESRLSSDLNLTNSYSSGL